MKILALLMTINLIQQKRSKISRTKSILILDECTLVSSDDFEDEEDCIEEKLEGYCQDIDNHDTTACKCASSRSKKKG